MALVEGVTVLCTEKDAVKLFNLYPDAGDKLLSVPLEFAPDADFFASFDTLLTRCFKPRA